MSHFTTISTKINDLDVLKLTLEKLGHPFVETPLSGMTEIKLSNHLSFRPDNKGFYKLEGDFYYAARDNSRVGEQSFVDDILKTYSYMKVNRELSSRGYFLVSENTEQNGDIKIVARRL